jgi:hypothetical protein
MVSKKLIIYAQLTSNKDIDKVINILQILFLLIVEVIYKQVQVQSYLGKS